MSAGDRFPEEVARKAARRLAARGGGRWNVWFGMGMFGMIGWSVALPTLLGIAVGVWIDERWPSGRSWTLMLLFGGLILGCFIAWHWIREEGERKR